ncbi:pyridoxal phosphate enzyme, YggS family, partial [gut metagenome]
AASKTQNSGTVATAAALPIDLFGENRVQELVEKSAAGAYASRPVHLIGHLQTNKVRHVVGKASLIHSVDSQKLLFAIHREAQKQGIVQPVLLEVNIAGEVSKSGIALRDLTALAEACEALPGVQVEGLMCIPPKTSCEADQHRAFEALRLAACDLEDRHYSWIHMHHLSMGMSGDFESAILEGSTIIRVGTAIFGPRDYSIR